MKETMRHPTPISPELGSQNGLAYALFLPDGEPDVGVVILHGAGSAKESHFDFARGCVADGMAALAYDGEREQRARRCPHGTRIVRISGVAGDDHGDRAERISRADHRPNVAGAARSRFLVWTIG